MGILNNPSDSPPPDPDSGWSPSQPTQLPIGMEFAGRYRVLRRLGKGGMGAVFLVEDLRLGRHVALKIPKFGDLDDEDRDHANQRFLIEARAAARLDHPNICPVFDVAEYKGVPYLTMKSIEGESLADRIKRQARFSPEVAVEYVRQLALVLAEAHRQGVIHRDLKPSNIMVSTRGDLIIMDFGLAGLLGDGGLRLTRTGQLLGTPAYMSPEQAAVDGRPMGVGCDIYSLGVILFELLTSRLPFEKSFPAILQQVWNEPAPSPKIHRADLDPRLEAICLKTLAKQPEERHASMLELAEALELFLAGPGQGVTVSPSPAPAQDREWTNSIGMKLVRIEPGRFIMGSNERDEEQPPHEVRMTRAFHLGVSPVTQGEYRAVIGTNPSHFQGSIHLPVEQVSWFEAITFCNLLSDRERRTPCYRIEGKEVEILEGDGYRLPTEAEWEYACRAGSDTRYPWGDNEAFLGEYAWYQANAGGKTHPVGSKRPNEWGLHDMLGNVWEWCLDAHTLHFYRVDFPVNDPVNTSWILVHLDRIFRGGDWHGDPSICRPASRSWNWPGGRFNGLGFRVAAVSS
ncbi:hypothetical protein BH23PLA1_BH23PLA1_44290 [soil metagenome]